MNYKDTIYNLQRGINQMVDVPFKITYNQSQFYSNEKRKPINMYSIKFVTYDEEKGKNSYEEVYKSAMQIFIVFFLRNLWYKLNGRDIPKTDGFPRFDVEWQHFLEEYGHELP